MIIEPRPKKYKHPSVPYRVPPLPPKYHSSHFIFGLYSFLFPGKVKYTGVTFAGQVGLLTAQKPNGVTITLDERDQGFLWENIFEAIFNKKAMPITFLIRDVISTEGMDFEHAVKTLSQVPLMADGYLIVGGVNVGEGAVVTRNRESTADVWNLTSDATKSPYVHKICIHSFC